MMEKTSLCLNCRCNQGRNLYNITVIIVDKMSEEKLDRIETHQQNTKVLKGGGKYVEVGCWCC